MKEMLSQEKEAPRLIQQGELIEGKIIKISKNAILIDLSPLGTGIIYGGELKEDKNLIKELKVGQSVSALVKEPENEEGYIELSLREAYLEKAWSELKEKKENNKTIEVKVTGANRGGLVIRVSGIIGFLPVSQLSSENYPRVEGGDKNKILAHLNNFIGKEIEVKIIAFDQKSEKLIVSEKATKAEQKKESLKKYQKGDVVEGIVTALTDFGAFIKLDDEIEGLAHISELGWQIIEHPSKILKEKERIKAQVIDIQNNQITLSLKALKEDPWQKIDKKYQTGQTIKGKVTKFSPYGAFVQIDKDIQGLAHVSEFSKQNQLMEQVLKLGQSYNFEILSLTPQTHRMSLGLTKKKSQDQQKQE